MTLSRSFSLALLALAATVRPATADEVKTFVAHIKLSGSLDEAPVAADPLFGSGSENFKSKLDRIKKAQKDGRVDALYLQLDGVGIGWAKLDELTRAIADFRKSGKKVFAFLESGSTRDYLIALACDEIGLPESGALLLTGMRMEISFYKELLDKLGVQADMLQMGEAKTAAEPFTRTSLSDASRKQYKLILDDHFDNDLVARIVKGRKLTREQVEKIIDEGPYTARGALKAGLVDKVAYAAAFEEGFGKALETVEKVKILRDYEKAKADEIDFGNPFALLKLLATPKVKPSTAPKVAVIYATGAIVTGKSGLSLLGGESCGSTTIIEAIRQAEKDDTVKAIVLRVDSPGGSALASDLMWNELRQCKKPVIASMSDVAASGGYYISMGCQKIYAEPGTLTGSIGVLGGKIVLGKALASVGITTDVLSRGANAGIFSMEGPFTPSERKAMTAHMRDIYDQFLDKAIEGRKRAGKSLEKAKLEKELAGGRVWTGRQAHDNGLIDELGGLDAAVAEAWKMAKMPADKQPELLILPKGRSLIDSFLESRADGRVALPAEVRALLAESPELRRKLAPVEAVLQLRGEPVWLVMPHGVEVK
jgi:protease-4